MNENKANYDIDIFELLKSVWNYKYIVFLFVIIAIILSAVNLKFFTEDTYTASGIIYVSGKTDLEKDSIQDDVNLNDLYVARTLSTTYIETLNIRSFLMDVSNDIGNKYSWREIQNMTTITHINDTELLSVSVTANSAQDAYDLANSILKLAPNKLSDVTEGGGIKIIDEVLKPSSPDGKGVFTSIIFSAFLGVVLAVLLIFLMISFDTKIHKCEDIQRRYNISVLGVLDN